MSRVPVDVDHHDLQESGRELVLALRKLRRGVERRPSSGATLGSELVAVSDLELALRELIAALDRRVPRVENAGEAAIARDARELREKAVKRLAELTGESVVTPLEPVT
jgi:hypothetical protein